MVSDEDATVTLIRGGELGWFPLAEVVDRAGTCHTC